MTITTSDGKTANSWFNSGERLMYEPNTKKILNSYSAIRPGLLYVFNKHTIYPNQNPESVITLIKQLI